jgi:hypothetical protein
MRGSASYQRTLPLVTTRAKVDEIVGIVIVRDAVDEVAQDIIK